MHKPYKKILFWGICLSFAPMSAAQNGEGQPGGGTEEQTPAQQTDPLVDLQISPPADTIPFFNAVPPRLENQANGNIRLPLDAVAIPARSESLMVPANGNFELRVAALMHHMQCDRQTAELLVREGSDGQIIMQLLVQQAQQRAFPGMGLMPFAVGHGAPPAAAGGGASAGP